VKFSGTFEDAEFLAGFANLNPDGVEDFRKDYPDFFPDTFWPEGRKGYSALALKEGLAGRDWLTYQTHLRQAWSKTETFPLPLTIELVRPTGTGQFIQLGMDEAYPYQRAVMYLYAQSWRAKICEECGNRFVADHAKRRYCSVERILPDGRRMKCSQIKINQAKSAWWNRKGKKRRLAKRGK
jgi:hypothetical protein